jgi:hypothetical protein
MIKNILHEPLLYLLPLLAVVYIIIIPSRIEISDVKITRSYKTEDIKLPYLVNMEKNEVFSVSFNLFIKNKSEKLNIFPDDCLQEISINGKAIPLDGINGLCDYTKGTYIDFSKYLQEGLNYFEFRIINSGGGEGGLRIEKKYIGLDTLYFMHCIFALLLLFSIALILRKLKFKLIASCIILLGITMRLIVYVQVAPTQNPYDVLGHLEYIRIISEEKRIPKSNEAWSTYHPPLYYVASAVAKNISDRYDPSFTNRILQQIPLLLSFASVILGVAFIINLFGNRPVAYLASLVSVLWPGFVLAAPRIGNDSLFYFGALLCMFFTQRHWSSHKNSDMLFASIGAAIALAAKSTGFVILGVWVIACFLKAIRSLRIDSLRILFASFLIIALSIGFSNYRAIADIFEGKKVELVANISNLNNGMKVQNNVGNYLYFDMQDFLLMPYTNAWNDIGGRQYFWNYAIKSSLYMYKEIILMNSPAGRILATALNILALLIFAFALWGIIHVKYKELPAMLFMVSLFAALIYLRANYPYSCSNNFHYILPALFPLAYFSVRGVQILGNLRLKILGYSGIIIFSLLSLIFILGGSFVW